MTEPDTIHQSTSSRKVTLKEAQPSLAEGRLFADYLNTAAEGFFSFMLGKNYRAILADAYLQPNHDLSYQHVTFAVLGDDIVGMVSCFTAQAHKTSSPKVLADAAGIWNLRFWTVSILFAPLIRIIDTVDNDDFYLQAIAVNRNARGKGVGSMLLDRAEIQAADKGCTRIVLDVSANNEHPFQIYQKRGYRIESTWPRHVRIPAIMFSRMAKNLPSVAPNV
jgi:ribosomal protein S18 acetylase RimI-like enzyme